MVFSIKNKGLIWTKLSPQLEKFPVAENLMIIPYFKMIQNIWQADYDKKTFPKNTMLKFVSTY